MILTKITDISNCGPDSKGIGSLVYLTSGEWFPIETEVDDRDDLIGLDVIHFPGLATWQIEVANEKIVFKRVLFHTRNWIYGHEHIPEGASADLAVLRFFGLRENTPELATA